MGTSGKQRTFFFSHEAIESEAQVQKESRGHDLQDEHSVGEGTNAFIVQIMDLYQYLHQMKIGSKRPLHDIFAEPQIRACWI
jgi:hypothetical protein